VSLAHHGVLFLDEMPEFKKNVLEMLRQPLEDGQVCISRAAQSLTYPASFMLVAAMNPCRAAFSAIPKHACNCTPLAIQRYGPGSPGRRAFAMSSEAVAKGGPMETDSTLSPGDSVLTTSGPPAAARTEPVRMRTSPWSGNSAGVARSLSG